ncbi:MAG TPA: peptide ABC transporter substrate-binding protein [Candidatus Baltobacteraceae bacterium]|nr:peptide ABC transporter substrate-binding protein [Candidatus Baltobacteraceae bacterium]
MKRFAAALISSALLLCACTKVSQTGEGGRANSWTVPHVLRYADAADVDTLNPMFSQELTVGYMSSLTAAWLVKWDEHNLPYPELATEVPTQANGGVSKDGLTITYHLRKGLRWSDGAPLNADDVVWTYHMIMNPATNVESRTGWDRIVKVDEPDKYTIVFHLSKPYAPFVVTFFSSTGGNPSILPKHLLAKYSNINHVPFNALPVGAGPFKYKEWLRSQRVVMVPNPYYFRGRPKLKEIDFEIIPNRDTIFTQLSAHELDMWVHVGGAYYARMNELSGFAALRQPTYQWGHIDFNLTRPALADPVVRHAIELATDRKTIIQKFARGVGILQEGVAPQIAPYYDPNIPLVPYDIAQANKLLDADGWKRGSDGIREKNGVKLDLTFAAIVGLVNVDHIIEYLQSTWKQIGVGIEVRHYPDPMFFAPYAAGGILYNGKWDITLFNWVDDPIGDFSFEYGCDQIPPAGQNDLHWCDPKANAAIHALYGHYDQAQRNADDRIVFEQLAKDRPQITLEGVQEVYIYNKDLKGFHPNGVSPFDNFMNVDI